MKRTCKIGIVLFFYSLSTILAFSQTFVFEKHIIDREIDGCAGIFSDDIDGDGNTDIVGTSINDGHVVFWRNAGGSPITWEKIFVDTSFTTGIYLHAGDVDGDGKKDIVAGSGEGTIAWWKNSANNLHHWTPHVVDSGFTGAHGIIACDLNNDSFTDILATSANLHAITWWENDGNFPISWTKHLITGDFRTTQSCFAMDIDRDGDRDVVGASSDDDEIAIWYNMDGSGTSWEKQTVTDSFDLAHWVFSCDLDGDGDPDILGAACIDGQIAWWENNGKKPPGWEKHTIGNDFACALTVFAEDFDNDGDRDVCATAWYGDEIATWENPGNPASNWTKHIVDNGFNGAWPIHVNDLDQDGDMDIVAGGDALQGGGDNPPVCWWENRLIVAKKIK